MPLARTASSAAWASPGFTIVLTTLGWSGSPVVEMTARMMMRIPTAYGRITVGRPTLLFTPVLTVLC